MKKNIWYFIYLLFGFLLVYYPPILPLNTLHIVGVISWMGIFLNIFYIKKNINIYKYLRFAFVPLFLLFYLYFVSLLNNNTNNQFYFLLYWLVDIFPAIFFLNIYFRKNNFSIYDILTFILNIGILQGFLTILAYSIPEIQNYFVNSLVSYGFDDVFLKIAQFRMYGFSSNLTFATPLLQGFLAGIAIYLGLTYKLRYYFYAPILIFSGVVNARVAIVVILITLFTLLFSLNYKNRKTPRRIVVFLIILAVLFVILNRINLSNSENMRWISDGIEELVNFINGDVTGYFTYTNSIDRYILPFTLIQRIFGVGVRVMGGAIKYGVVSDIGYINDIWLGGYVYCMIIYAYFFFLIKKIRMISVPKLRNFLFWSIFLILIITNIKGYVFNINDFTTVIFLISFSAIYLNEVKKNE